MAAALDCLTVAMTKDCVTGWILLSALGWLQRDYDKLGSTDSYTSHNLRTRMLPSQL